MRDLTCWVLTDGKAGDEQQCLGVAEALGLEPDIRRVSPRAPWVWAMPWGPVDPRERPGRPGGPLPLPFPDVAIASGRRAVPYLKALKRASKGRTYTVFLKDPRTGPGTADLIWVPEHDRLRGANVLATLTPPHRVSADRLAQARTHPDPRLAHLRQPRIAVLVGGDSRHHSFKQQDIEDLLQRLRGIADQGALMITASRRTPAPLRRSLEMLAEEHNSFFWNGAGDNPYIGLLALADAIVVTADSYNMIGEATATGTPILVFEPSGGHPKLRTFLEGLQRYGAVKPFTGQLEARRYPPLDSTPVIARAIASGLARHRSALGLAAAV